MILAIVILVIGIALLIYSAKEKDNSILPIISCIICGVGLVVLFIKTDKPEVTVETRRFQVDTVYTVSKTKIDTSYVITYLKHGK